jgi:hypothetical protein
VANVLVAYFNAFEPMRLSLRDHLDSFDRYSVHDCWYFNFARSATPSWLTRIPFDHVILHTSLLSLRWSPEHLHLAVARLKKLDLRPLTVMAFPQDEFTRTELLGEVLTELGVTHVFSVAPESEWPKIYANVDRERVVFRQVLTGYLDPAFLDTVDRIASDTPTRDIDVGYRAWRAAPWLGRLGRAKAEVGEAILARAPDDLVLDISTRDSDVLLGDDWIRFLLRCRTVLGVESGASVLDATGELQERTDEYTSAHPDATFEEVEQACFPGADGQLGLAVIGPRHLEACAARACQVLVRGSYSGVLDAGVHYVPLESDYGNLDEVIDTIRDEAACQKLADAAYEHVVASGRYSYEQFVASTLDAVAIDRSARTASLSAEEMARARADDREHRQRLLRRCNRARAIAGGLRRVGVRIHPDTLAQIPEWSSRIVRGQQRLSVARITDRWRTDRGAS